MTFLRLQGRMREGARGSDRRVQVLS
jgi:hypothetical protein